MTTDLYELRFFRVGQEDSHRLPPVLARLDLDADDLQDQLDRYLIGAARRWGDYRDNADLYHLVGRRADRNGQAFGDVLFSRALPATEDTARRW